jgi:hypothetical protein
MIHDGLETELNVMAIDHSQAAVGQAPADQPQAFRAGQR